MLVLSRKTGQGIRIGDAIRIMVVAVDGQFVRIGIEAPASSKILREELWHSIAQDNQAAATAASANAFAQVLRGPVPVLALEPPRETGGA
ncbi:MAG TPA: carbon storage regulator CsrA [Chloroflexota bacterium]|jgi:carbon storage regulator